LAAKHERARLTEHDDVPGGRQGGSGRAERPFAAALQWQPGREDAPRVTARGDGALAEAILRVAFDRGVKVRTDADLAAVLRASELDREIPYAAFAAVAEILAYVYQANAQMAADRPNPGAERAGGEGEDER
jgi:flagellar biosynthesis protein